MTEEEVIGPLEQRWQHLAHYVIGEGMPPEAVIKIRAVFYQGVLAMNEILWQLEDLRVAKDMESLKEYCDALETELEEQLAFRKQPDWTTGKPRTNETETPTPRSPAHDRARGAAPRKARDARKGNRR